MPIPFPLHFPNQIFKEYRELSLLLRKSLTIVITKHLYSKNIQRNNGVEKGLVWGLRGGVRSIIIILMLAYIVVSALLERLQFKSKQKG